MESGNCSRVLCGGDDLKILEGELVMNGTWVGCGQCESPLVMGQFLVKEGCKASIDICGLGFFELYINGKKVSEDLLTPVWSDYGPREGRKIRYPIYDQFSHRVYYCSYELDEYVKQGDNVIEILLGNGWYNQHERLAEGEMWYDKPKLWFDLCMTCDGKEEHIVSGEWLRWRPSYITYNNVYMGEIQDLRMTDGMPGSGNFEGFPVNETAAPGGEMMPQNCPADRIIRTITPICIGEKNGRRIFDAGENITGWAAVTVQGEAGAEVMVRYAETLDEAGELDFTSAGKTRQIQKNCYISSGTPKRSEPHFTWHGFRYFDIEGCADVIEVCVVHSDVAVTGSFSCSDETINWLVDAYLRSRLGNMHCGVPMDCPHRERLGYTGDGQAACGSDFYLLDCDTFYRKWMQDIADCQCKKSGHVQHTAPFYGGGGGPGGWGGAIVLVPWEYYRRYKDKALLAEFYPRMIHYIEYMRSRLDDRGLVAREEKGGWCLGDWCAPDQVKLPEAFVNTYYLVRCMQIICEIECEIGTKDERLEAWINEGKAALRDAYYDESCNTFVEGEQGADAFALDIGLGNEAMAKAMAERYDKYPAFDTGFLATGVLIRKLFDLGYGDTAVKLLMSNEKERSFGWERLQGATTLWERWNGYESRNHPMFGGVIRSLFEGLIGINCEDELVLKPFFTSHLDWVKGSSQTRFGMVSLEWKREGENIAVSVEVPCAAELILNGNRIVLDGGRWDGVLAAG